MRRMILFVIALALLLGGSYLLILQFTQSRIIYGAAIMAGGMMIALGSYIFYADFLGGEDEEE
jgi:hypothetical protein